MPYYAGDLQMNDNWSFSHVDHWRFGILVGVSAVVIKGSLYQMDHSQWNAGGHHGTIYNSV